MSERITIDAERVDEWVRERAGLAGFLGPYRSLAYLRDGKIAGAVVYDGFTPYECCMHLAIESPPVPLFVLRAVFGYPFEQLKLKRVTATMRADNEAAIALAKRNGFVEEGRKRRAFGDCDEVVMGLLPEDCEHIQ